ncbi:hypothetical protein [Desulfoscipio sp. XC116]|uniref:hypothetical protein n=1 Tax=Desulfoscipio sp. XC116 TaxID=3144975 RepID=UPI00325B182A
MDKEDLIELLGSFLEGLEHAKSKMNEGALKNGIIMLHNMVDGYYQAELFLQSLMKNLTINQIARIVEDLRNSFDLVTSAYEHGDSIKAMEFMKFGILSNFKKWQKELNRCLLPHVVS